MAISLHHPAALIALLVSLTFVAALLDAAISDLCSFRIANRAPLLLLAAFPPVAALEGFSKADWLFHIAVGLAVFAVSAALFVCRLWGGGDAKLAPAVTLWIGIDGLPHFLLVMAMMGCALSVIVLIIRMLPLSVTGSVGSWRHRLVRTGQIPYGVAIAVGGLNWWISTVW